MFWNPTRSRALVTGLTLSLVAVLAVSCTQPDVIQPPTPEAVEDIYRYYAAVKAQNPTALEELVKSKEVRTIKGTIWRIEGKSLQFLIDEVTLGRDAFVDCKFPKERDVISFSIGSSATVYGKLDEAFDGGMLGATGDGKSVKFMDCAPYPHQQ